MTLETIWNIVHTVLKKESRGNIIKPDEFTHLLQQCHLEYYNQQYEKYAVSQTIQDSLRPFLVLNEYLAMTSGSAPLSYLDHPYRHAIAAYDAGYPLGQAYFDVYDIVTPQQYVQWKGDPVMNPSDSYPILCVENDDIRVSKIGSSGIYLTYLAECSSPSSSTILSGTATMDTEYNLVYATGGFSGTVSAGMKVVNTTDSVEAYVRTVVSDTTLLLEDADGNEYDAFPDGDEDFVIIEPDLSTDYYLPFFDYYTDSNDEVQYLANGSSVTLTANDTYRDGTAGDGSTVFVGVSHELKWNNGDKVNIVALLLQKLGLSMQAPDITQYAMALQQQQNVA